MTSVLHTWGSALTHHPHVHMIVPGGGLSPDGARWVSCRPGFFLPVRVLSRLFRRLFLEGLSALHGAGKLAFFGDLEDLADPDAFAAWLAPLRKAEWVVYAKPPFGGPEAVLAYLSRYTHRVAISNSRLVSADAETVAFRWKDYRIKNRRPPEGHAARDRRVHPPLPDPRPAGRLPPHPALRPARQRRPQRHHRQIRDLLGAAPPAEPAQPIPTRPRRSRLREPCPDCGGPMRIIETFRRGERPTTRAPPPKGRRMMAGPSPSTHPIRSRHAIRNNPRLCRRIAAPLNRHRAEAQRSPVPPLEHAEQPPAALPIRPSFPRCMPRMATPLRFPHRPSPTPRGFLLGRFSNAGRGHARTRAAAAARIGKPSPKPSLTDALDAAAGLTEPAVRCNCNTDTRVNHPMEIFR